MTNLLRRINSLLLMLGVDLRKTINSIRGLPFYFNDLIKLKKQKIRSTDIFKFGKYYPCLDDRFEESGISRGHYFHQDLLVARRINLNNPLRHVDVGSRIDGFITHVASFRKIEVLDIRPILNEIPNINFRQADLMGELNSDLVACCDSLSCLHALEHFGLGRYGDTINYDGYLIGLNNLWEILKQDGKFYFSVPIGPQRIEFNAHRVFSVRFLMDYFLEKYRIDQFSFVDDQGDLHENITISNCYINNNYGCTYGCGIFEMTKI